MTVEVIRAVAWPTVVLVALIIIWRTGMMAEIGRRVTRVSVFQVSLELATATARAAEDLPGLDQLRDRYRRQSSQVTCRSSWSN